MILSKKNMFVFLKGRKVAGTSVEVFLSSICGSEDIITPITPIDERYRIECGYRPAQNYGANNEDHNQYIYSVTNLAQEELFHVKHPKAPYYNHMKFTQLSDLFGEITDKWFVFAVERCPYSKIISLANMQLGFKQYKQSRKAMKSDINMLKCKVSELIKYKKINNVKNIKLYKDHYGNVKTHFLKFENLDEEIEKLMIRLDVASYPKLPHLKKGIYPKNSDFYNIFSIDQLKIINDTFQEEFELYGYEMIS
jgi:hypothetical protein